jgi:hypothetical protein
MFKIFSTFIQTKENANKIEFQLEDLPASKQFALYQYIKSQKIHPKRTKIVSAERDTELPLSFSDDSDSSSYI